MVIEMFDPFYSYSPSWSTPFCKKVSNHHSGERIPHLQYIQWIVLFPASLVCFSLVDDSRQDGASICTDCHNGSDVLLIPTLLLVLNTLISRSDHLFTTSKTLLKATPITCASSFHVNHPLFVLKSLMLCPPFTCHLSVDLDNETFFFVF